MTFLEQKQLYFPTDSDYQESFVYGNMIDEIEFHIISDAANYIGMQGFSKLSPEEVSKLRAKTERVLVAWVIGMEHTQKQIDSYRTFLEYLENST